MMDYCIKLQNIQLLKLNSCISKNYSFSFLTVKNSREIMTNIPSELTKIEIIESTISLGLITCGISKNRFNSTKLIKKNKCTVFFTFKLINTVLYNMKKHWIKLMVNAMTNKVQRIRRFSEMIPQIIAEIFIAALNTPQ